MDSPCIKQTVCKVLKIFQYGKYLVAYVLNIIQLLTNTLSYLQSTITTATGRCRYQTARFNIVSFVTKLNTYKPGVLFVGYKQTVQTQLRRRKTRRLIRVSTVFLKNVLSKLGQQKTKSTTRHP